MAYHTSDLACGHSDCGGCDEDEDCAFCDQPESRCDCTLDDRISGTKRALVTTDKPEEIERLCEQMIDLYRNKFKN